MADSVEIRITASDGSSQVFRKIAGSATQMGDAIERAGTDGERSLTALERTIEDTTRELQDAERQARSFGDRIETSAQTLDDFGAGLTAVGLGLAGAGRLAMDQERQIIALRAAYGDAADEMLRFAEELDTITIFSDDDIREGERFFATLRNNYGFTIEQIQEVARITADLASAAHIDYADAANRVTAALRGEAEAAEYLGLTMNQQAIDRENLTLTMSNQEAALFRLNALREQSAVYEGTAAEIAEGSIGTYAEMTDTIQDLAAEVGDFIGPWGSMVTGFGTAAIGISGTVGAFSGLTRAMRNTSIATTALSAVTSPLALGLTAIVGTGALVVETYRRQGEAASNYADSVVTLTEQIEQLRIQGDALTASSAENLQQEIDEAVSLLDRLDPLAIYEQMQLGMQDVDPTLFSNLLAEDYNRAIELTDDVNDQISAALSNPDIDHGAYIAWVREELDGIRVTAQGSNIDEVMETILNTPLSEFSVHAENAAESLGRLGDATAQALLPGVEALAEFNAALEEHRRVQADHAAEAVERQDAFWAEIRAETEEQQALDRQRVEEQMALEAEAHEARLAHTAEWQEQQQTAWEEERSRREQQRADEEAAHEERVQRAQQFLSEGMSLAGFDDPLSQINLSSLASDASLLAENLQVAGTALDNVFRGIVGTTEAMGQQLDNVNEWALDLINVQGEYGRIDDLLAAGVITLEQYNAAQAAQASITQDVAQAQEWLLRVQTMQAPYLADAVANQEAYIEQLAFMEAEQQRVALAWMDTNTAAQAQEGIMFANAVAMGEWGAQGEAAFDQFIRGAVAANPLLFDIWESMGLISGTPLDFQVNTEGFAEANSEMERLTSSVLLLADVMDDGELNLSVQADIEGDDRLRALYGDLIDLDNTEANPTVTALTSGATTALGETQRQLDALDGDNAHVTNTGDNTSAMSVIGATGVALANLDGDSATVTVNAINNAGGVLGGVAAQLAALSGASATVSVGVRPFATGGAVWADDAPSSLWSGLTAASGRTVMVGEAGPELVTLPHGSQVMPHGASMSRLEAQGGMGANITINIEHHGGGADEFDHMVETRLIPALAHAIDDRHRAFGMNYRR